MVLNKLLSLMIFAAIGAISLLFPANINAAPFAYITNQSSDTVSVIESTVFLLGCQEQGSGPVGPEGTGIQAKPGKGMDGGGGGGGGDGCGNNCVFVNVKLTGWMITEASTPTDQMELVRKGDIIKLRANTEKNGTPFLSFAIDMSNTLTELTSGDTEGLRRASLNRNCVWSGRIEQTDPLTDHVIKRLPFILTDPIAVERSVLVGIDNAFVAGSDGTFVSESENNTMAILPNTVGSLQEFRVKGGAPTVVVDGDPAGDNFTATFVAGEFVAGEFVGGKLELVVAPPEDSRNVIHLSCNIFDDISFEVEKPS